MFSCILDNLETIPESEKKFDFFNKFFVKSTCFWAHFTDKPILSRAHL